MTKQFNCPACGKLMDYDGQTTLFQTCKSCGAPIVVPANIVETSRDAEIESIVNMPTSDAAYEIPANSSSDSKIIADARIVEEIKAGNKIMAIKLHREAFNTDLKTAKEAVETLERNIASAKKSQIETLRKEVYDENQMLGIIYDELSDGNKINAIKIFRETFSTGLKEAKDAVDAMERGERINISDYL